MSERPSPVRLLGTPPSRARRPAARGGRWIRLRVPRTLRARLTGSLVVLLAAACAAVGVTTVLALESFLVHRLDQQLTDVEGRFPASLEHEERPDADNRPDTRGQSEGTFGARLLPGEPTRAAVVRDRSDAAVPLTGDDRRVLTHLDPSGTAHSVRLSALGGYRVVATRGDDGDVLVTGLPLKPVEETVHRLELVECVVFGSALAATGATGALWVRLTLHPLARVTATASRVAELPLASGEVAMPGPVPDADPRTEVGRVSSALNRMLGHVGDALARRHASEERLRHFAADASHELRTPVASVRGHAELALRHPGPVPDEVRHALERIQAESQRMSTLVDEMLLLARLDAGRPLEHRPVDLTRLVLDATGDAQAAAPGHGWTLDLPEEPVIVCGDEHRLTQVIGNLLANARVHTPPGTEVIVRLTADGAGHGGSGGAELTVADNGPGIPEALTDRVFDRFTRADTSRSRSAGNEGGSGSGLGLSIVRAVTEGHNGSVVLESRTGATVFRIRLPAGCTTPTDGGPRGD